MISSLSPLVKNLSKCQLFFFASNFDIMHSLCMNCIPTLKKCMMFHFHLNLQIKYQTRGRTCGNKKNVLILNCTHSSVTKHYLANYRTSIQNPIYFPSMFLLKILNLISLPISHACSIIWDKRCNASMNVVNSGSNRKNDKR